MSSNLNPNAEIRRYITDWWAEENTGTFHIGRPDRHDRELLVYIIEAARVLCSDRGDEQKKRLILALLKLAIDEIEPPAQSRPLAASVAATDHR